MSPKATWGEQARFDYGSVAVRMVNDMILCMGDCIETLTARQRDCLLLVSQGFTTKEIASRIGTSPDAIDKSIKLAMRKLGVDRRAVAARLLVASEDEPGYQSSDSLSSDLSGRVDPDKMAPSPQDAAMPPAVAEDRARFTPALGPVPLDPPVEQPGARGRHLSGTINRILEKVFQIAGVLLMVVAFAYLLSVVYHRWEALHHIAPRGSPPQVRVGGTMTSPKTNEARTLAAMPVGTRMSALEQSINHSLVQVGELIANIGKARLDRSARIPLSIGMAASEQVGHIVGALSTAYRHSVEAHRHFAADKDALGLKVVSWGDVTDTFTAFDDRRIAMSDVEATPDAPLRVVA